MRSVAALAMVAGFVPRVASASSFAVAPSFGHKSFVLAGIDVGLAVDDNASSWLVGAEASVGKLDDTGREVPIWFGSYVDILVDGLHDHARVSLGGEVGYGVLGLDVGPVLELGSDPALGLRARAALSLGVVSLYGGPVVPLSGEGRSTWVELGVLLKFPFVR